MDRQRRRGARRKDLQDADWSTIRRVAEGTILKLDGSKLRTLCNKFLQDNPASKLSTVWSVSQNNHHKVFSLELAAWLGCKVT